MTASELVGKPISCFRVTSEGPEWNKVITFTLATTDKEIFMFNAYNKSDDNNDEHEKCGSTFRILREDEIKENIISNQWIRDGLIKTETISQDDIDRWVDEEKEQEEESKMLDEKYKKEANDRQYETYLQLKKKFEKPKRRSSKNVNQSTHK